MKIYFVTYGNVKFKYSARRIVKEAKSLNIFDKVRYFSEVDLPLSVKSSPLFTFSKGGGYWLWKPYVIQKVLTEMNDGDILVYSDAGNTLLDSPRWEDYINCLKVHDSIFFQYKSDFDYGWPNNNAKFNSSPKIKYWTKKNTFNHFASLITGMKIFLKKINYGLD